MTQSQTDEWAPDANPLHRLVQVMDVLSTSLYFLTAGRLATEMLFGFGTEDADMPLSDLAAVMTAVFPAVAAISRFTHYDRFLSLTASAAGFLVSNGLPHPEARHLTDALSSAVRACADDLILLLGSQRVFDEYMAGTTHVVKLSITAHLADISLTRLLLLRRLAEYGLRLPTVIAERSRIRVATPADLYDCVPNGIDEFRNATAGPSDSELRLHVTAVLQAVGADAYVEGRAAGRREAILQASAVAMDPERASTVALAEWCLKHNQSPSGVKALINQMMTPAGA